MLTPRQIRPEFYRHYNTLVKVDVNDWSGARIPHIIIAQNVANEYAELLVNLLNNNEKGSTSYFQLIEEEANG